jgi:hypothetical protein
MARKVLYQSENSRNQIMKMKSFANFGLVALAAGAFLEAGLPVKADQPKWVNSERVQFLKAVGNAPLSSRSDKGHRMPAVKVVGQENSVQGSQLPKDNEKFINIYKSLTFLGGA